MSNHQWIKPAFGGMLTASTIMVVICLLATLFNWPIFPFGR